MLLAFAILSHHAVIMDGELLPGTVSVRLFFILSGFYMALILDGNYRGRLSLFYSNRLLRLFPAYLLVAACSFLILLLADAHPFLPREEMLEGMRAAPGLFAWLLLSNMGIIGQDALFLLEFAEDFSPVLAPCPDCPILGFWTSLVPQAWSIAMELWFYLLAPFLVRLRSATLLALALASLGLHAAIAMAFPEGPNMAHHFFPAQLHLFIAGLLSFRLHSVAGRLSPAWGLYALALTAAAIIGYRHMHDPWRFPLLASLLCLGTPLVFNAMRNVRWDRLLGELSYPVYLVQFLVIALCDRFLDAPAPPLLTIALVLGSAALVYVVVDRPMTRLRWRRLRPEVAVAP